MAMSQIANTSESHVLQSGANFALVALLTPLLPHSVLVQLMGRPGCGGMSFSLYAVYREESMTFDAMARFDPGNQASMPTGELLQRFVARPSFEDDVLGPLVASVRKHFAHARRSDSDR